MQNKRITPLLIVLLLGATAAHAQTVPLDTAISGAADTLSGSLEKGSKVAVLSMRADSAKMANHLIEELISAIVQQRIFTVVDRARLDLIQREMELQLSGEVSDESAQAIGKKLGAQVIVTGSFEALGDYCRLRLRAIAVETAAIVDTYSADVRLDPVVVSLLGNDDAIPDMPQTANTRSGDFTPGQRWGTWALNIVPGLGSFVIMRDTLGGLINLGLGGAGLAVTIVGAVDAFNPNNRDYAKQGTIMMISGGAALLGGGIFNIVRSATYHKPHSKPAALADPKSWRIAVLPGKNGIERVYLGLSLGF